VEEPDKKAPRPGRGPQREVILDARELFRGRREVVIEHEGVRYRLRITRRKKLILQK